VLLRFHAQDREPTYPCVEAGEERNDKSDTGELRFNLVPAKDLAQDSVPAAGAAAGAVPTPPRPGLVFDLRGKHALIPFLI
jgi:hypothetical protein